MKLHREICEKFGLNASDLPTGAIVAYVDVVDCVLMTPEFISQQSEAERSCGNWEVGNWAWQLQNLQVLDCPIPIAGKQGLWFVC
jgi:hypothetical protein